MNTTTDDLMVACCATDWGTLAAMTAPSGWALVGSQDQGSNNIHTKVWYKVTLSGDSGTTTYAFGQSSSSDGTVTIITLRGADAVFVYSSNQAAAGTSRVAPSITPNAADDLLIGFCMVDSNNVACTWTAPGSMAECSDVQSTTFTSHTVATEQLASATATGTRTFTATNGGGSVGGIQTSVAVRTTAAAVVSPPRSLVLSQAVNRARTY